MSDEILTLPHVEQLPKAAEKTVYTVAQKAALPGFKVWRQRQFRRAGLDGGLDAKTHRADGQGGEGLQ